MEIKKILFLQTGERFPRRRFSQPLGLLYLISALRQKFPGRFQMKLLEQALWDLGSDELEKIIKDFSPELVCLTSLSFESGKMVEAARIIKWLNRDCITAAGGPHATVFYDQLLREGVFDFVIIGEGEETFCELVGALLENKPFDDIAGLAFKKNNQPVFTGRREPIMHLDKLPFPAWDLVDFKKYSQVPSMNAYCAATPWAAVFTSRSCPYQCAYCHNIFGKKVRLRSAENVLAEIELLVNKYGVKELQIVDDIFNFDSARAKKICDLIVERGIKVKICFPNAVRTDLMDRELVSKLRRAGCYSMAFAVETASPRMQKLIDKNLNLEKVKQVISWAYEEGIIPHGYFMLGFPGETPEEMEKTVDYALKSDLMVAIFFTVVVYPRTKMMEIAQEVYPDVESLKMEMTDYSYWARNPFYKKITGFDVARFSRRAYRRFYFRPKIVWRFLKRFPKNISVLVRFYGGLRSSSAFYENLEKWFFFHYRALKANLLNALK